MIRHFLILLPAVLLVLFTISTATVYPADWIFHLSGNYGDYPFIAPWLTNFFFEIGLLIPFALLISLILPYIILSMIDKNKLAGAAYLYLTGIPYILLWGGFIPTAFIFIYMLLNVLNPVFWFITPVLGYYTHREWIWGILLSVAAYVALRWKNAV